MNKTQEKLKAARKLLGKNGEHWIQGEYHRVDDDEKAGYCSIGALLVASGQYVDSARDVAEAYLEQATKALIESGLPTQPGATKTSIAAFNDHKGREFADIKKLFKTAIELAAKAEE